MVFALFAISVTAYVGLLSALLFYLERRHRDLWRHLGSPPWFYLPAVESWAFLKFLFLGEPRHDLQTTVQLLLVGTRVTLVLAIFFFLLFGLQQSSGPGPEG